MIVPLLSSLSLAAGLAAGQGTTDPQLTGTWSSKSMSTFTGPKFFDPSTEQLFEPKHTGISYSFSSNGYYEEAYYRAIANPVDPSCPQGIMQWQHGSYQKMPNGSLVLTPIAVDGRQLLSDPCNYDTSVLTRYNQSELFLRYDVGIDSFYDKQRLDLYQFNGAPLMPLYLADRTPDMLPTTTLNPTNTPTSKASATGKSRARRELSNTPIHQPVNRRKIEARNELVNADRWWWLGVAMTGFGGMLYYCF